ncbi:family C39 peptidase [Enterococcus sp. JM4C]|nr:family C39 peptidase [Enterococcus sp. JM4C]
MAVLAFPAFQPTQAAQISLIDVPLENQNEGQALGNGCEITALSMLLRYYDYQTNKNQLANLLTYVPVNETAELHGNPHEGFVGDITGGSNAMGVAVEPVAVVAKEIVADDFKVIADTGLPFEQIEKLLRQEIPVWVETTVDFQVPGANDFRIWQTKSGEVTVTPLCHAVVITGTDDNYVYVNDPFGEKNRAVAKQDFLTIYQAVGEQSLYLLPNK